MFRHDDNVVIWLYGVASAIAAKEIIDRNYRRINIRVVHIPKEKTKIEQQFLRDIEEWIDYPIDIATPQERNPHYDPVIFSERLSQDTIRKLRNERDKDALRWEEKTKINWHVLGFTTEEEEKFEDFRYANKINVFPVLINEKLRQVDCCHQISRAGIKIPKAYRTYGDQLKKLNIRRIKIRKDKVELW